MKILILGFQDKQELKEVMEDFIVEKNIYLFTVLCGGVNQNNSQINKSITQQWAEDFGAPIEFIRADTPERLIYFMSQTADYIVLRATNETPAWQKNLLMKMKAEGKHGKIIRDK